MTRTSANAKYNLLLQEKTNNLGAWHVAHMHSHTFAFFVRLLTAGGIFFIDSTNCLNHLA